jgi:hypothetical protein
MEEQSNLWWREIVVKMKDTMQNSIVGEKHRYFLLPAGVHL